MNKNTTLIAVLVVAILAAFIPPLISYAGESGGSPAVTATLGAGNAIIGKVGIDQTTPGTTDSVTVATAQGAGANIGLTTDISPASDANGTLNAHARLITKQLAASLPASLGAKTTANSTAITIASDQGAITTQLPSALVGGRLDQNVGTWLGSTAPTVGSKTSANSVPVVIASDQGNVNVVVASALPTGANTIGAVTFGDPTKTTYSFGTTAFAPANAATDMLTIAGSGTKTVKIRRLQISGTATAAGAYDVQFIVRSSADTIGAGSSATPTMVKHNSGDAAATSVVTTWNGAANPNLGTLVGVIRSTKITVTTSAGAIPSVPFVVTFGTQNGDEPIVLNGTAQVLAINLNGATMAGGSLDIDGEITEE